MKKTSSILSSSQKTTIECISKRFFIYILSSVVFWIILYILSFIFFYNSDIYENSKLLIFNEFFTKSVIAIIFFLILSIISALILSIPSICIRLFLELKLNKRKKHGQKPIIFIFLVETIPIFMLIIINLMFFIINASCAPDLFQKSSTLYSFFKYTNSKIYERNKEKTDQEVFNFIRENKINTTILIPDYIMNNQNFLKKIPKIMVKNNWFISSNSIQKITRNILNITYNNDKNLYFPLFNGNNMDQKLDSKKNKYKIISSANIHFILNSNVKNATHSKGEWVDLYLNRLATSQYQLMLFFKLGLGKTMSSSLGWENMSSSLSEISQNLLQDKKKYDRYLFLIEDKHQLNFLKSVQNDSDLKIQDFILNIIQKSGDNYIELIPYSVHPNRTIMQGFVKNGNKKESTYESNNTDSECSLGYSNLDFSSFIYKNIDSYIRLYRQNEAIISPDKNISFLINEHLSPIIICKNNNQIFIIKQRFEPSIFNSIQSEILKNYSRISFIKKDQDQKSQEKKKIEQNSQYFRQFNIYKINDKKQRLVLMNHFEKDKFIKDFDEKIIHIIYTETNKDAQ